MPKHWSDVAVADLQAPVRWALNGGPFGSKLISRDYKEEGVPVVRGTNLSLDKRFGLDDFVFVSEAKADELLPNNAHPGDVVFTQRGTLGQVGIIPRSSPYPRYVISQSQMKLTVDDSKADADWLYYYFCNPATQQEMINRASASGVPHINLAVLREFRLSLPPLDEQRRIASILSAYDDLIENNTRRITILEEMARHIYEEWFVHFRFPGYEHVRMVVSELGPAPKEWRCARLEDIAMITMGLSPKSDTYNKSAEGTPLINGPVEFGEKFTKQVKWTTAPTKLCDAGDLIVCVRGSTTGKYVKSDGTYCLGRGVCSIHGRYQAFVDQLFIHELPTLLAQTGGSTFPSWTGPQIKAHRVLIPTEALITEFDRLAQPMSDAIQVLSRQSKNLRTTRDLLLPRLISGELNVSELPEPEAVAA